MKYWKRLLWWAFAFTISAGVQAQTWEQSVAAYKRGDYRAAITIYRFLAEQGDKRAFNLLGSMYENGVGVPKDEMQAVEWYRKSAEQGDSGAQLMLGHMYEDGRGVPKDERRAVEWFRKSAAKGSDQAQYDLGRMYVKGRGVPKDNVKAALWYLKAAEQGHPIAQMQLCSRYIVGLGVPKDERQAAVWCLLAAEQANAKAQHLLGLLYSSGQGVPKDERLAYFWLVLAGLSGDQSAKDNRDILSQRLTPDQRVDAILAAHSWKAKVSDGVKTPASSADGDNLSTSGSPNPRAVSAQSDSTGSGFRVARGAIVTNHHVIDGCSRLRVNGLAAQVRGSDARSDLALLNTSAAGLSTSLRAQRAAVGEPVAVAGYPLRGLLSGFNMTTGNLSSLSGMGGDTRLVQITAPVQPGNSGGPVLDSSGNLMGVVVSKLDAIKAAKLTGDIPQNVNFAINTNVLRSFLDANSVEYETASSDKALLTTAIAEKAKGFTVLVECWK